MQRSTPRIRHSSAGIVAKNGRIAVIQTVIPPPIVPSRELTLQCLSSQVILQEEDEAEGEDAVEAVVVVEAVEDVEVEAVEAAPTLIHQKVLVAVLKDPRIIQDALW
jgi:hypothetical protein